IQFPAVLFALNASVAELDAPASRLVCCTRAIPVPEVTLKLTPLLATPPTVTTTFPVVAPLGTGTVMLAPLQFVGVAVTPLNVTVPVAPKFVPVTVTEVPTAPEVGFTLVMLGAVPLPLLAALNAARPAAHKSAAPREALTEVL